MGQVDHNDIPLQRIACTEYAKDKGWTILKEFYERGVSGYKISSDDRDAIQDLKEAAENKEFDILLVFMFDRLGRRDDETPFVVEWFAKHGIEVWSVKEGEQRFDSHVDKLMNYIRYWQASGESEKTSVRVRTRQIQMIQDGIYRGGFPPYGYRLEHIGRVNKKNQPVRDLVIDEDQAKVVRKVFELMVTHGYGTERIALWLNDHSVPTSKRADCWRSSSIRTIMRNPIYTGHLHLGNAVSNSAFEQYRIISDEDFLRAQEMMDQRGPNHMPDSDVSRRVDSAILLTGLVRCQKCGGRMYGSAAFKKKKDGHRHYWNQYRCETRLRKSDGCYGQWCYSATKIEGKVLEAVQILFRKVLASDANALLTLIKSRISQTSTESIKQAAKELAEARSRLSDAENRLLVCVATGNQEEIGALNAQLPILRSDAEEKERFYSQAIKKSDDESSLLTRRTQELQELRTWAVNFDLLSHEEQKLALAKMLHQITVGEGYSIEIEFRGLAKWIMEF